MFRSVVFACVVAFFALLFGCTPRAGRALESQVVTSSLYQSLVKSRITLSNQWKLSPAGISLPLGDLPLQMVVSPSRKYAAVTNNGVGRQFIQVFDLTGEVPRETDNQTIAKSWYGLAFSADEKRLFASGGNDNTLVVYNFEGGKIGRDTVIDLDGSDPKTRGKKKLLICPAGIACDARKNVVYTVTKEDSALYVCDWSKLKVVGKVKLPSEPYSVVCNEALNELYVSLWGMKKVLVFDRDRLVLKNTIDVGDHPNELILNKKGTLLMVANSLDNSVSIVDLVSKKVSETLNAALFADAPNGSTTNSLALSDDEKTLYIANADNNCLAVFDVETKGAALSKGFIPTGWYPTSVRVVGNKVFVVNGKGMNTAPNPEGPNPFKKAEDDRAAQYIGSLFLGTLSTILQPNVDELAAYSKVVYENTPYTKEKEMMAEGEKDNPIPMKVGDKSPIKYVFYIIKENRTYDNVLGDMKEGNGDANLCIFPEKITPNQHSIARNFVLLDNFYCDAEVSADGHNWSTAAYATDFVEKTWVSSYGRRGGNYDFEGQREIAFPKGGFIWDYCKRQNVSYRTYGEFADGDKANYKTLVGHICPGYSSWDLKYQDVRREKDWERDFDSLLLLGQVPQFSSIRFGNDHTSGLKKGSYSPTASVADNDAAVGNFIAHLSKSSIWKESAVFIVEDDAQNGSDHVDAHRTTAYVVSPYVKRKAVNHNMYSTSSMLRTIELILGLPPMSQYDAAATPMYRCFSSSPNFSPFVAIPANVDINERNVADSPMSKQSAGWNLAKMDAVPDKEMNEVLWKGLKGVNTPMPAPTRAAFVRVLKREED
jgi:DNA-binding beta-propeller fold protein YncE/phospholipase C